ncbi:nuclear transport factor 2 family protein [Alteraurantiacibacter aquimixticola]|nr:nuclear transport factor 2 family protein [Alteraurantiacibacter aquimixticola]
MKIRFAIAAAALALSACNDTSALEALEALEARVQAVEDQLAIQRVITDYSAHLDARDYDGYVGLFTEDGVWANGNTRREGREEIRAMLEGLFGEVEEDYVNLSSFHYIANFEVDVEGDEARSKSRFIFFMRGEGGAPMPELSGQYHDRLVRTEEGWKIAERVDHTVMPTPEEWVAEIEARGLNSLED